MTNVSRRTFDRRTQVDFTWEAMSDVTRSGMVEVRDTRTNRRFMVQVNDR